VILMSKTLASLYRFAFCIRRELPFGFPARHSRPFTIMMRPSCAARLAQRMVQLTEAGHYFRNGVRLVH
jgi:hypothetical protein